MSMQLEAAERFADWSASRRASRHAASLTSDLLPVADFVCLLVAAWTSAAIYGFWIPAVEVPPGQGSGFDQIALFVAALAPFLLYDRRFGAIASRGDRWTLVRSFALRFSLLTGVLLLLGSMSASVEDLPFYMLAVWFTLSLLLTALIRGFAAGYLRRLRLLATMNEVLAGFRVPPVAGRLVMALREIQLEAVDLPDVPGEPGGSPNSPGLVRHVHWGPEPAAGGHTRA